MADYLDIETAKRIAVRLKSIPGLVWDEEVIEAIARAFQKWCTGAIIDNRVYPAEAQALAIVGEAEYWPKWRGIAGLYAIFRSKFVPEKLPGNAYKPPVGKRVIECAACDDTGYVGPERQRNYCDCPLGEGLKADLGEAWLETINSVRAQGPKKTDAIARELGLRVELFEHSFHEFQENARAEIADAKAVLEDENATRDRKEIARAVLERYEPELKKKRTKKPR